MKVAAVTGTNGKSSTIHYARQILEQKGKEVWTITNTGVQEPGGVEFQMFWCRERGSIEKIIKQLSPGKEAVVLLEAYSISLMADEWFGTHLDLAAFTSFGRDHLDVHSSMSAYFEAKFMLFKNCLKPKGTMIVHKSIPNISRFLELSEKKGNRIILYDDKVLNLTLTLGILPENFNCARYISESVTNLIINPSDKIFVYPLSGRMERVENSLGINIFIDYAHNPDGLNFVLKKLKPNCKGKMITVLGCGGDRDPGKRIIMGKVANQFSDKVIVTDDNSRTENPAVIRKTILEGCPDALEIPSRKKALNTALLIADKNDTILIAGMGSDTWPDDNPGQKQTDRSVMLNLIENFKKYNHENSSSRRFSNVGSGIDATA
jgi:UDP-N-acetylmuramoyl-L-alanyl-D-glutamate--2,6-diaminopimelate ligase